MKLSLPTAQLLEGIGHAAAVAAAKSPKPILECVVLRADKTTGLTIEATDLDVGLRVHVGDVDVVEEGSVIVPAARLLSVVREIDEDETDLVEESGSLRVDTGGRSVFRIRVEVSEEFPTLPFFPQAADFSIETDAFRGMVRRTAFAAAREAGRFALHGVLLTHEAGRLEMVATDGRRLARSSHAIATTSSDRSARAILGPKALLLLERALGSGHHTEVDVAIQERQALLRSGDLLVISRLIDGTFPAIENVIPDKTSFVLRAQVADLASGLRRASLLTTRDALSVELMLDPESVTIRSRAAEIGEAKVEVPVKYQGDPLRIGFNPVYLQDALKVMDPASEVTIGLNDAKSPGRMTDGDDYVYVISPIALE